MCQVRLFLQLDQYPSMCDKFLRHRRGFFSIQTTAYNLISALVWATGTCVTERVFPLSDNCYNLMPQRESLVLAYTMCLKSGRVYLAHISICLAYQ